MTWTSGYDSSCNRTKFEPMKPQPPVIRMRLIKVQEILLEFGLEYHRVRRSSTDDPFATVATARFSNKASLPRGEASRVLPGVLLCLLIFIAVTAFRVLVGVFQ